MLGRTALVLFAVSLTACGGSSDDASENLPLAEPEGRRLVPVEGTAPAAGELAPSQISAETVAPPELPDVCALEELSLWTARVDVGEGFADAVIRVRNDGDRWCEVGVGASPRVDARIEPDVWLEPGDWADLVVGQSGEGCEEPELVTSVDVAVGGDLVKVPTAMVATCGWELTAFYANDRPTVACNPADLRVALTEHVLLVGHEGFVPCAIGDLAGPLPSEPAIPPIRALAGGDVAAWPVEPAEGCGTDRVELTLVFEELAVTAGTVSGCVSVGGGPGRPFFGGVDGPFVEPDNLDVDSALAALDPFPADAG